MEQNEFNREDLRDQSIVYFAALTASDAPFPGGGGVTALTGALSAALCSMVCNLTVGRKKYAAVEDEIRHVLAQADRLRERLLVLIDEDAIGFQPLANAYSIPKDDPNRQSVMLQALQAACTAPIHMLHCLVEVVELLETLLDKGSTMLISDVGVGAALARAALVSAGMNIFINTASMPEGMAKHTLEQEVDSILEAYIPRAECVSTEVQKRIRKEAE